MELSAHDVGLLPSRGGSFRAWALWPTSRSTEAAMTQTVNMLVHRIKRRNARWTANYCSHG